MVLSALLLSVAVILFSIAVPPTTLYMSSEARRLGGIDRQWMPLEKVSPVTVRSIMAAEDADFCRHWGFDIPAIRAALKDGARRGASTISQQMVKNLFLWQGRSWTRKALEGAITPLVEAVWSKRRIMEVYLNIIEFDEGVFGIAAAARHYFQVSPSDLSALQAARLAMVLPDPKNRDAAHPTEAQRRRAAAIMDGAATLAADGRAVCTTS